MAQSEKELKELICEIGRRVYNKGFAAANDGNITIRLNEKEILCTPTMISKGYMTPDDICKVDYNGNQISGKRKRTSEVLLHLVVYKLRPDVNGVVHCHPPHATAFCVAHEPIPKCILPEVEVFLGEVPMAVYETPGDQRFAETIAPYVKDCNTVLLANHGTITFGPDLMNAYWNTEIIDAYCNILILSKQLGRVNFFDEQKTRELLALKKRLGYDDVRFHKPNAPICGVSSFADGYGDFVPTPCAFEPNSEMMTCRVEANASGKTSLSADGKKGDVDIDTIVRRITEQVMSALS